MTWKLFQQQQQRGAQLPGEQRQRRAGEVPAEAVEGREGQDHEQAGEQPRPEAGYPASELANRDDDITPTAREPEVDWDEVVQPEKAPQAGEFDDRPLPEGK